MAEEEDKRKRFIGCNLRDAGPFPLRILSTDRRSVMVVDQIRDRISLKDNLLDSGHSLRINTSDEWEAEGN